MDKIITIKDFKGFGNNRPLVAGEYFLSLGMMRTYNGIGSGETLVPIFTTVENQDLNTITGISYGSVQNHGVTNGQHNNDVVFCDTNSNIFQRVLEASTPTLMYRPTNMNFFGGAINFDQLGNLIYIGTRYVGRYTPYDVYGIALKNYDTGTVTVTNGSPTVTGVGTAWVNDATMVGKSFHVQGTRTIYTYKIQAVDAGTQTITLANNYGGASASGASYTIYTKWTDQWLDFGSDSTVSTFPTETFEDFFLIGRENKVAGYSTIDNPIVLNPAIFTLPKGFNIRYIHSGKNGVLIVAYFKGKSVLVLWDGYSTRSSAPWITVESQIAGVCKDGNGEWLFNTTYGVYRTNGYSVQRLTLDDGLFDMKEGTGFVQGQRGIQDGIVIGDNYYFNGTSGVGRIYEGVYAFNLSTKLIETLPLYYGNGTANALFHSPNNFNVGSSSGGAGTYFSVKGTVSRALTGYYVSNFIGDGDTDKTAAFVNLHLGFQPEDTDGGVSINGKIRVKIATSDRKIFSNAFLRADSTDPAILKVDGTLSYIQKAEVGDEVEIVGVQNPTITASVGVSRHILSKNNEGTNTEEWVMDSAYPITPRSSCDTIVLSPFKLIAERTITNLKKYPQDLLFTDKNGNKGKKFMIKVTFEGFTGAKLEMRSIDFVYNDLGTL